MTTTAVILAAGKGKRMNSSIPKVLHSVGGQPMLAHVLYAVQKANIQQTIVVVGHEANQVVESTKEEPRLECVKQTQQLGTAHAVEQALPKVASSNLLLVLYGDCPLVTDSTIKQMLSAHEDSTQLTILTFQVDDPAGYGRIIRGCDNKIIRIVEQKDATKEELQIKEVNSGIMLATAENFNRWIKKIKNNNQQQEFYLTDCVAIACSEGSPVESVNCEDPSEVLGVNDRVQLAQVEKIYQKRIRNHLALKGVTFKDIDTVYVNGSVNVGKDILIGPGVELHGNVSIGDNVIIESNCSITNSIIENNTIIHSMCHIEGVKIGNHCEIGPYARLRPEAQLSENVKIGNFVEVKKATIKRGSKVNHLSYVGDCNMGEDVNVGAGTITCNYDGAHKHQTIIGNKVFIGSDSQLVAPVEIGEGATIGAGSTITKDVPPGKLTLSRAKQLTIENWKRPSKS